MSRPTRPTTARQLTINSSNHDDSQTNKQTNKQTYHCIGDVILHQVGEFHPNRTIFGRVMMLYQFLRWWTLRRNFTSAVELADVPLFNQQTKFRSYSSFHV